MGGSARQWQGMASSAHNLLTWAHDARVFVSSITFTMFATISGNSRAFGPVGLLNLRETECVLMGWLRYSVGFKLALS